MGITSIKTKIESAIEPIAARLPISPNVLTLIAVLVMLAAAWQVVQHNFLIAAALVLLSGLIDVLDGTVAKSQKRASLFGQMLDRTCDRISDALIFGSVIFASLVTLWLGLFVLVISLIASYASACIEAAMKTKIGEALSMRAVRLLVLVAGFLVAAFANSVPANSAQYIEYAFYVIAVISTFAFCQRMWTARKILGKSQ